MEALDFMLGLCHKNNCTFKQKSINGQAPRIREKTVYPEKSKHEEKLSPENFQPTECPNCGSPHLKWGYVLDANFVDDLRDIPVLFGDTYKNAHAVRALHCTRCDHLLGFYVSKKDRRRIRVALGARSCFAAIVGLGLSAVLIAAVIFWIVNAT